MGALKPAPETPETQDACDVVVIGAGMSGLVAGALLAQAGLDVRVVESQRRAGGYLAGFRRKDFIFDTAIHWLNQCGPGGLVQRVLAHIGPDAPVGKPLTRIRRYKGDSFDVLLTANPDELKRDWIRRFPGDRAGIERFFRRAYTIGGRLIAGSKLMRTTESMNLLQKAYHGLRLALWGMPFLRTYALSAEKGMRRYFKSEELRKVFATESDFVSILAQVGWAYHHDFQAPPPGGSQAFPRWLVGRIEAAGSRLILGRRVGRILVEDGAVRGIELEAESKSNAKVPEQRPEQRIQSRYVIATCDVLTLYEKMLPPGTLDEAFLNRLRRMELYQSSVTISLGLDCPVEELGFDEEMWMVTRDDVPRAEQNGPDPEKCAITILAPSCRDPSLAPEGKGTLTVYTSAEMAYGDNWRTGPGFERGAEYRAFKKHYADTILARVEQSLGIDLRRHIEVIAIATPITHWRYTGNQAGTIMGERPTRQNIKNRIAHYRTPVARLYRGGHWAEYGGGVPMVTRAGANASILVLKEANPTAYRRLCKTMAGTEPA